MDEKLTDQIQGFRIGPQTKEVIWKLARKEKRQLTEYIRLRLEQIADQEINELLIKSS